MSWSMQKIKDFLNSVVKHMFHYSLSFSYVLGPWLSLVISQCITFTSILYQIKWIHVYWCLIITLAQKQCDFQIINAISHKSTSKGSLKTTYLLLLFVCKISLLKNGHWKILQHFFIFRYNITALKKFVQKPCKYTYTVFALWFLRIFISEKLRCRICLSSFLP